MRAIENLAAQINLPGVRKEYIGDGVYADYDGYHIILTAENGIEVTNRIALEGQVVKSLERYVKTLQQALKAADKEQESRGGKG